MSVWWTTVSEISKLKPKKWARNRSRGTVGRTRSWGKKKRGFQTPNPRLSRFCFMSHALLIDPCLKISSEAFESIFTVTA